MSRILMIDPEPHLLAALEAAPVLSGHEIVAAHGDIDALRRLRCQAFDVVITCPATTVEEDLVLLAYREVLLSAIEHGAGRAAGKLVDVAAVRTERALVFYVRDPGRGFDVPRLPAGIADDGALLAEPVRSGDEGSQAEAYRPLVARTIVDEMFFNERADEVILIKHVT
jgi:hypothetical protein